MSGPAAGETSKGAAARFLLDERSVHGVVAVLAGRSDRRSMTAVDVPTSTGGSHDDMSSGTWGGEKQVLWFIYLGERGMVGNSI